MSTQARKDCNTYLLKLDNITTHQLPYFASSPSLQSPLRLRKSSQTSPRVLSVYSKLVDLVERLSRLISRRKLALRNIHASSDHFAYPEGMEPKDLVRHRNALLLHTR